MSEWWKEEAEEQSDTESFAYDEEEVNQMMGAKNSGEEEQPAPKEEQPAPKEAESPQVGSTASSTVSDDMEQVDDDPTKSTRSLTGRKSVTEIINNLHTDHELHPSLQRRVRDFRFAQGKRRDKYGNERPWGILGLYDHLAGIRIDLEWAEDAAWRRQNGEVYLSWTDYEKARAKGHNRPFFVYFILFVCTIMMIVSIGVNGWKFEPMSVNPMLGPSAETLVQLGAKQTSLIVNAGQWWRLFSPMVLHAGLIHYFVNMLALYFVGSAVEKCHGLLHSSIAFILPAVGGTILSAIFLPQYISVGASGGIFGYLGNAIADIAVNWNLLFIKPEGEEHDKSRCKNAMVLVFLVFDIGINCLIGLCPFVDNFTHLGGLIYGFLSGLSTIERLEVGFFGVDSGTCGKIKNVLVKFGGLLASVLLIMITSVLLVQSDGVTAPCNGCRYISCVPFPPGNENKWWYCDDCNLVTADALKSSSQDQYFQVLDMTCPDGSMERINITDDRISDREDIRKQLPDYCRENCEVVYNAGRL